MIEEMPVSLATLHPTTTPVKNDLVLKVQTFPVTVVFSL